MQCLCGLFGQLECCILYVPRICVDNSIGLQLDDKSGSSDDDDDEQKPKLYVPPKVAAVPYGKEYYESYAMHAVDWRLCTEKVHCACAS